MKIESKIESKNLNALVQANQPPLPLPSGFSRQEILDALLTCSIDDAPASELRNYA